MSEEESFLERWARRKRDAAKSENPSDAKLVADAPPAIGDTVDGAARSAKLDPPSVGGSASGPSALDLTKLPSLDSITAATDIRAFLQPGVPAELSRAALRRAWSADPAIRDFVGLADYDWDFNTDGAITGFGPLEMTAELRRRVSEMVGRSLAPDEPDRSKPSGTDNRTASGAREISGDPGLPPSPSNSPAAPVISNEAALDSGSSRNCEEVRSSSQVFIAPQQSPDALAQGTEVVPRRHGRALPK